LVEPVDIAIKESFAAQTELVPQLGTTWCHSEDATAYQYLSSEQALADFATLIPHLRDKHATPDTPVFTIGGSYGGMLAAWMRFKFPHLVAGAIASSAPVVAPAPTAFYDIVAADYKACAPLLHRGFAEMWAAMSTAAGRAKVSRLLGTCGSLVTDDATAVLGALQKALVTMAQLDYPYAVTFMNASLPPYPVAEACRQAVAVAGSGLEALVAAVMVARPTPGCWNLTAASQAYLQNLPGLIPGEPAVPSLPLSLPHFPHSFIPGALFPKSMHMSVAGT